MRNINAPQATGLAVSWALLWELFWIYSNFALSMEILIELAGNGQDMDMLVLLVILTFSKDYVPLL